MVPDYYAMLGVDPGADRAAIEAALARCQPAWSSGTRNPKTKHTFQSYLDQIPALRQALLADPLTRAAYDAEILAARRAERDGRLDVLQKRIKLRAAKGGLTVSDRRVLRDEAERLGLTGDDLDRLVESIPPKPEAPTEDDAPDPPLELIDPVMRRQLRVALDHLRKRDLYDALDVPRDAPPWDLAARADAARQRWMKKSQMTAEKTAWLEVVTLAQAHLTTPAARARYDRTLDAEAEDMLADAIAFALKGLSRLDPGTRSALLDEAAALGIAPDRAEVLIRRGCKAQGVARDGVVPPSFGSVAGPPRLLRCRSCGGVTDHATVSRTGTKAACRHCGASLHWACPVDRRSQWVDEPRCGGCGFRIELVEPVRRHFEAAQDAFRHRDYTLSIAHLKRVQELAPNHAGARKGVERVKERVTEIDHARSDYEIARAGARLVEAKTATLAWGRLVDPSTPEWRAAFTEVTRGLRDAQALLARARGLERSDPAKSRELYRRALALASDLPEARLGLDRAPPSPPSDLTAEFIDDRVKLRWAPPPPDGLGPVSYVIVRKPNALPRHPADGVRIGTSTTPTFEDLGATPGTSVAYAVQSVRGGVESAGAVAVGPIFLLGEVRGVRVETRSREVDLWWTPPTGAAEIRVVRKRGSPPKGPLDGEHVEAGPDQAHDRGLEPDRVYHYGIYAVFRTRDGKATASRGVIITAQPHTPVHAIEAPSLYPEADGRVTIRWVEPARGLVKLIRSARPLPHPPGTRLSPNEADALEGDRIEVTAPDYAVDSPPMLGGCYYTPLTTWGGMTTVGHPAVYSCVTDPTDLRASRSGQGQVQLRWRWSPHGTQSLVILRSGTPPTGPDDPHAHIITVHESEYARQGRYTLMLPTSEPGPWHVVVYAITSVDGQPVTSPGNEPSARTVVPGPNPEITVSYGFRRPKLHRRSWSITFHTDPPNSKIPPTVVVTHPRTVPLSADDGTIVATFEAAQDGTTYALPDDVNLKRTRARVFADPRVNPDGLPPIRLVHPEAGATRV